MTFNVLAAAVEAAPPGAPQWVILLSVGTLFIFASLGVLIALFSDPEEAKSYRGREADKGWIVFLLLILMLPFSKGYQRK